MIDLPDEDTKQAFRCFRSRMEAPDRPIEMFQYNGDGPAPPMLFRVSALAHKLIAGEVGFIHVTSPIDKEFATKWITQRDLNMTYVHNMPPLWLDDPVLGVEMPDNTVLLIDGSHRYMARYLAKLPTIDYFIVPRPLWLPYATIYR